MKRMSVLRRGLIHRLAFAAAALLMLSVAPNQRADAMSLIGPGAGQSGSHAPDGLMTEVRHGGGGHGGGHGGFHGGGFHGGFHGGGFHGGRFHGGGFRAGGFHHRGFYHGGFRHGGYRLYGHRFHRHFHYGPSYYYHPHRRCRIIWTHYGRHRICHWHRWHHRGFLFPLF
nr:hypothetical protein [Bradyrhizobium sp. dw_78]